MYDMLEYISCYVVCVNCYVTLSIQYFGNLCICYGIINPVEQIIAYHIFAVLSSKVVRLEKYIIKSMKVSINDKNTANLLFLDKIGRVLTNMWVSVL